MNDTIHPFVIVYTKNDIIYILILIISQFMCISTFFIYLCFIFLSQFKWAVIFCSFHLLFPDAYPWCVLKYCGERSTNTWEASSRSRQGLRYSRKKLMK